VNRANKPVPHIEVILAANSATPATGVYSIGIHYIVLIASTPLHLKYCMNMSFPECSADHALRF
jgi:hypothetical protein